LDQTTLDLVPQFTAQLTATPRDAGGAALNGRPVTWQSAAETVASVSTTGLVTGVAAGSTTITATSEGRSATATVVVSEGAVIGPAGGVITANGGKATITIPAGALAAPLPISVRPLTAPPAAAGVVAGTAYELGPTGTTFAQPVTLEFSYETAPLDSLQPLYRVSRLTGDRWVPLPGSTQGGSSRKVTATTSSFSSYGVGFVEYLADVEVLPAFPIVLYTKPLQLTARPLDLYGAPLLTTNQPVGPIWTGPSNVTITPTGLVNGVIPGGPYLVNATYEQWWQCNPRPCNLGNLNGVPVLVDSLLTRATRQVEVFVNLIPVNAIAVSPAANQVLPGQTVQLSAALKDAQGTALDTAFRTVTWATDNAAAVSVSQTGLATAVGIGTATISAISDGVTGTATVTVAVSTSPVVSVEVRPVAPVIEVGSTLPVTATGRDAQGQPVAGAVTWVSLDQAVATISTGGLLTGVSLGQAPFGATIGGVQEGGFVTVVAPYPLVQGSPRAGGSHTCFLRSNQSAWCWGNGSKGQRGDGVATNFQETPTPVSGGTGYSTLSAGEAHSCAVGAGGQGFCWGDGGQGRLGNGSTSSTLTPVSVVGGPAFGRIDAGGFFSCGLDASGAAYCWGAGQMVGDGSNQDRTTPTTVGGGLRFVSLAAGRTSTCGLTASGAAWCWGSGDHGALGNGPRPGSIGTTWQSLVPAPVSGGHQFVSLGTAGGIATTFCGLTAAGEAWCWGQGSAGQVGDGGVVDQVVPTRVATSVRFTAIGSGASHTCALAQDQTAWCWGSRGNVGSAQLGLPLNVTTPIQVFGGRKYTEISAGGQHTCARAADGTWCWGLLNFSGELGKGGGNVGAGINTTPVKVRFP
jgi:alpha-tubulin suppressor-like RCC1 family protein/uncharacterized protein YjdB